MSKPKPRLSALPESTAKTTLKKRSKSLGGPALEQLRANNLADTLTFELTPRKKARRSLLPGKSILKSRPSCSGLERTTSDNTLTSTLNLIPQLPSRATSTGPEVAPPHSSQPISHPPEPIPSSAPKDSLQANAANQESNAADNSSDMDLSDDQGLNRTSLGSNTTNLLRRVSFAAKAHVRTFGSPFVDPDCSTASSNASNAPNQPPAGSSSSAAHENTPSEGDQSADMSLDNSLANPQVESLVPPISHDEVLSEKRHHQNQIDPSSQPTTSREIPNLISISKETQAVNNPKKGTDQNIATKPSRLTELFSQWGDLSRELENAADENDDQVEPQVLKVNSESLPKKYRSRISEFLQPAEDSAEDTDEGNLALIDFDEVGSNANPRSTAVSSPQPSTQENEDLMNISFEYRSNVERAAEWRISNSAPGGILPDSQSTFRVDSFPNTRLSVGPWPSSIRNFVQQQQISSASPSRRLSGSLSGTSPKKSRFSFASPRRSSTVPATLDSNSTHFQNDHRGSSVPSVPINGIGSSTQETDSTKSVPVPSVAPSLSVSTAAPETVQSSPQPLPPPPPTPPATISLNEFFEQAEIKFISLSQPRVRNHDHQQDDHQNLLDLPALSCFSDQIFAGMVKIPRLRLLESSSRSLKQKTDILDLTTKEHESLIEKNSSRYKILKEWMALQEKKKVLEEERKKTSPGQAVENQKELDDLNSLMNRLRLKKSHVELEAKRDSLLFEIDMWKTYQSDLHIRTAKLNQDLEMMRKIDTVVKPTTESLRDRKLRLTEAIRTRKQKIAEIESCDQNKLEALKAEAKELLTETEANRRALTESEFEKNLWLGKFSELEQEKIEHVQRIEEMKLDPNQTQKLTVQELVRLKNEFENLQSLMGWKLVKFDEKSMEFDFLDRIRVVFHLDIIKSDQHVNVGRIELSWTRKPPPDSIIDGHYLQEKYRIESFFFDHLKAHYHAKGLSGRVKKFVQEISSIWNHARELTYEIMNVSGRFKTKIHLEVPPNRNVSQQKPKMKVVVMIRSRQKLSCVEAHFSFDGQEILDWKSPSPIAHLSCTVLQAFGSADCLNLSYIITECLDKGQRGGMKEACLEALNSLQDSN